MNVVGIDLGTTFSAISVLNSVGRPEIVANEDGERITPSVLFFHSDTNVEVGTDAINLSETDNDKVARWIKRSMGEEKYSNEILGKTWPPSLMSSFILKKLVQDFEHQKGKVDYAVVTVPAYFDEIRRKATLEAAKLAGINIKGIINEPTAAALYYSYEHSLEGKILVYDLGGGTFDVTILDVKGQEIDIITTNGDHHLGGYDFDMTIMKKMLEAFKSQHGEVDEDRFIANVKLQMDAESIKKQLSKRESSKKTFTFEGIVFELTLSKNEFEAMISAQLARIDMLIELLLEEAELTERDIDNIVLVGGSTRMPYVKKSIEKIFGKEPLTIGSVDECVALGAAIYCGIKVSEDEPMALGQVANEELNRIKLQEVCTHSYGTRALIDDEVMGKPILKNTIIIPKDTKIPVTVEETFYTIYENQDSVKVNVTQGEGDDIEMVNVLAEETLELPSNRPAGRPVKAIYSYDANQVMSCKFIDVDSGRESSINISIHDGVASKLSSKVDDILDLFDVK